MKKKANKLKKFYNIGQKNIIKFKIAIINEKN